MKSKLPIGVDDFKKLIDGNYRFADKSLFIKDILEDGSEVIVITRPRRFGKTLNLSMLYHFLQQNHHQGNNLFENLAIAKEVEFCRKHQQQYPVIFVSFKDVKQSSYEEAYGDIIKLISNVYEEHSYLLDDGSLSESQKNVFLALKNKQAASSDIRSAIQQLSLYVEQKFRKQPIILLDEYDTPIQSAYLNNYYQEMVDLMRSILGQALKGNKSLHKAIVTGITRIAQESLFSGVNNLKVYSLLNEKYGQYFGLTEDEVIKLMAESGQEFPLEKIREWYNGYQVGKYTLYNPWSIINCLAEHGALKPYWLNTSSNDLIDVLLGHAKPTVKQQLEELLQGNIIKLPISENLVFPEIERKEEALWSLLLYAGYLKVLSNEFEEYQLMARVAIPNKEIGFMYDKIVRGWFSVAIDFSSYSSFIQSLVSGDIDKFKAYLSTYIVQSGSYFDFNKHTPESVFHSFILGLVLGLRDAYIISSNQETGFGRSDVVFIPKDKTRKGIVLEFKTSPSEDALVERAKEALAQIKEKQYLQILKQHEIKIVCAIGMAFCGRQVELVHENIQLINN